MADLKPPIIKPLPPNLANVPGVSFTRPPDHLILDVSRVINDALKTLEPYKTLAVVTVITDKGANAALVAKFNDTWSVAGFMGKEWGGKVEGGAYIRASW
jgi:hypothetical protein